MKPTTSGGICESLRRQLNRTKSQEDVDKIVKAAKDASLPDKEFQSLMRSVLNRRRQMPHRN